MTTDVPNPISIAGEAKIREISSTKKQREIDHATHLITPHHHLSNHGTHAQSWLPLFDISLAGYRPSIGPLASHLRHRDSRLRADPRHPATPPTGEPTNAKEADAQRAKADALTEERYQALVAKLPPDQQEWERMLQKQLGGFYLPAHKRNKVAGQSSAWDFVQDDPNLPRVLLIGDSVSRGYTLPARKFLSGRVSVHRAPTNCGATATGLKNIEVWLGDGQWDLIHFNFGIHDRSTPIAEYTQRLEKLVERMKKTGAKLVWATTTPIPDNPSKKQSAASIVERNEAAAELMKKYGVATDDLFAAITPNAAAMQIPNDVHFKDKGYDFLGETVAKAIEGQLPKR